LYRKPANFDSTVVKKIIRGLKFAVVSHVVIGYWMYNQPQIFSDEPFLQSEKMMAEKRPVKDAFRVIGIIVLVFILCLAFCFTSILEYYSKLKGGVKYKEANAKTEEGAKTRLEEALKGSRPLERDLYTKCNFGVLTAMWYHVNEY
jgi:flagellar basal body-associated protein FliL